MSDGNPLISEQGRGFCLLCGVGVLLLDSLEHVRLWHPEVYADWLMRKGTR